MSEITNDDVVQFLGNMSVVQVIALTKELEEKWGVKAAPPTVQLQQETQQPDTQAPAKDEFNVVLVSVPADKKMAVIKAIRENIGLGLKESKELAEAAPKVIKEQASKADADDLVAKLTAAGAVMEMK